MIKFKKVYKNPYSVILTINIIFLVYAFIVNTPLEIITGLFYIVTNPSLLITDYVEVGGIGATLVNTGLIGIIALTILKFNHVKPSGATIMSLWLLAGFSMFGKNIFNIIPIFIGGWLFAKVKKEPVSSYSLLIVLSTALSPIVSGVAIQTDYSLQVSLIFGIFIGLVIGFIMPPITAHALRSHGGYNLYNVGFAGGILAIIITSILKGFGMEFVPVLIWNTTSNLELIILLFIIFIFLIILGLMLGDNKKENFIKIHKHNGRLLTDYYSMYGEVCYINMGVLGILSTILVLLLGSNINGGSIAGIFSVVGFGALGKHIKNITPIMIGCVLGAILSAKNGFDDPAVILAILFGTCLAPFAGTFGFVVGVLTGYLHINLVMIITPIHGGLNLYNNGLAAGLVAMIMLPIVNSFKRSDLD